MISLYSLLTGEGIYLRVLLLQPQVQLELKESIKISISSVSINGNLSLRQVGHSQALGFNLYSNTFWLSLEHDLWIKHLHEGHGIEELGRLTFLEHMLQLLLN